MIKHNYHTHTIRCGHASGTDEEIIQAAINAGFETLGFSEHICSSNGEFTFLRMEKSSFDEYLDTMIALKEKYSHEIDIKVGFEVEYCTDEIPFYKKVLNDPRVEYFIFGPHNNYTLEKESMVTYETDTNKINDYCKNVIEGMESGMYKYVAHPDLYMKKYDFFDETCKMAAYAICNRSKQLNIPLEINLEGIKVGLLPYDSGKMFRYRYPVEAFWEIAGIVGCPVIVGVDSHSVDAYSYHESFEYAHLLIKKYNLCHIKNNFLF